MRLMALERMNEGGLAASVAASFGMHCAWAHKIRAKAEVYFWDESGCRADAVQGTTWAARGHAPVVAEPGQRTKDQCGLGDQQQGRVLVRHLGGALNGAPFVGLLSWMMKGRRRPLHVVLDGWPAHKTNVLRGYVHGLKGKLTLHFLPDYAPGLNPDGLAWHYAKRRGLARRPWHAGGMPADRVHAQLTGIAAHHKLVRS